MRDIWKLRRIQELSDDGINLTGVVRILELETEVDMLRERIDEITEEQNSTALVVWRPKRRRH